MNRARRGAFHDAVSFFSFAVAVGMAAGYLFSRAHFSNGGEITPEYLRVVWRSLAAAAFLLFIPSRNRPQETLGLFAFWCLAGWLSPFFPLVRYLAAFVSLALLLRRLRTSPPAWSRDVAACSAMGLCFGTWLTAQVWNGAGDEIFLAELLPYKYVALDRLVHVAGMQMYKTFALVTSGIDGIASVRYHYGAHWMAIRLGQWLNIGPFLFLHLTASLLFIPFCLQSMLNFAGELRPRRRSAWWACAVVVVAFVALIPYPEMWSEPRGWHRLFRSFNYSIAVGLAFQFFSYLLQLKFESWYRPGHLLFICAQIGMLFWTKVSVGYGVLAGLGYLALRHGEIRRRPAACALPLFTGLVVLRSFITYSPAEFTFADFWSSMLDWHRVLYLPMQYGAALLYVFLRAYPHLRRGELRATVAQGRLIDAELLVVVALFGALPGLVMRFPQANHNYFVTDQRWLALTFLASLLLAAGRGDLAEGWRRFPPVVRYPACIAIGSVIAFFCANVSAPVTDFVDRQAEVRVRLTRPKPFYSAMFETMRRLDYQTDFSKKRNLVYIPRFESSWRDFNCYTVSFAAVALSGHALLDGMPPGHCPTYNYGMHVFAPRTEPARPMSRPEMCAAVLQRGFEGVWRYEDGKVQHFNCRVYDLP